MKCVFMAIIRSDMEIDCKHSVQLCVLLFPLIIKTVTTQRFEVMPDIYIWRHLIIINTQYRRTIDRLGVHPNYSRKRLASKSIGT
jgi:hypothetical protein